MLFLNIILIGLGFLALFFGAKLAIISLENISHRFGVSHLMVGLTILAIGTSLPEIAVSISGGIDKLLFGIDTSGIVIGNKIGSFFTQITLILGILGLTSSIFVDKWVLRREGIMLFVSLFIFLVFSLDLLLEWWEAIVMIIIYAIYLLYLILSEKKVERQRLSIQELEKKELDPMSFEPIEAARETTSIKKDIGIFLLGLILLITGGELSVVFGSYLAEDLNVPASVIGILIVGLGTSLPELTADLTALRRESHGIAIGDILGSNICDILLATGSGAVIANFNVDPILLYFDIPMLFGGITLALFFLWREKNLKKYEASILIGYYAFYVVLKLLFFQI